MSDLNYHIKMGVYFTLASIGTAIPLALVLGYGWVGFAKLWIMLGMNIFGLPLLLTDLFTFPLWVWYIIVLNWIGKLLIGVMAERKGDA